MITYLTGNETPTAARMNAIFSELDRKLGVILGGRSFVLAFATATRNPLDPTICAPVVPWQLLGRCFFFLDEDMYVRYADRVPGFIVTNTPTGSQWFKGQTYNHAIFTGSVAAHTNPTFHDTEKIVDIDAFPTASYEYFGIPQYPFVSMLDQSLQAHTITHEGAAYFVRERISPVTTQPPGWNTLPAPEKHYDYALAEIILEGQTAVEFPETWDKYQCFRVHNLNDAPATLTFKNGAATVYTLTLPAFACQTLRRDDPLTNYRLGGKYFFTFEGNDPRFFWFHPTSYHEDAETHYNVRVPDQPNVSNSMVANNLTNPAIAWDWLNALTGQSQDRHAWMEEDPHELYNAYPLNAAAFGNPATGTTLLGDLLHHKGKLKILKTHKTDPMAPVIEDDVEFQGYATIVADFAAKGITVGTSGGNLTLSVTDATYHWDLYSTRSNLLKTGEVIPFSVRLTGGARVIESAVFDNQDTTPALATTSPPLIWPRTVAETANTRTYTTRDLYTGGSTPTLVTGDPTQTLVKLDASQATRLAMAGIHAKTVADLLTMEWFGKTGLASQNTDYSQVYNSSLALTPHGLVLAYTERFSAAVLPALERNYYYEDTATLKPVKLVGDLSSGWFEVKKVIRFRGHGWGYCQPGYQCSAFWVPRYDRRPGNRTAYVDEIWGEAGADLDLQSPQVGIGTHKLLSRLDVSLLQCEQYHQRFWTVKPLLVPEQKMLILPLLPEHYNALAAAVNARKTGRPLDYSCLRIDFGSGLIAYLNPDQFSGLGLGVANAPVPYDCFDLVTAGSAKEAWYEALGITIRTAADLPAAAASLASTASLDQLFDIPIVESLANEVKTLRALYDFPDDPPGVYPPDRYNFSITADVTLTLGGITNVRTAASTTYTGAAGTAYGAPSPVPLATCYTNIRWVSVSDFKLAWETAYPEWPFLFREVAKPYTLELLQNADTPEYDTNYAVMSGTMAGIPVFDGMVDEDPVGSYAAFTATGATVSTTVATFTGRHLYQVVAFRPTRDGEDTAWKCPAPSTAPNPIWHMRNRNGDFLDRVSTLIHRYKSTSLPDYGTPGSGSYYKSRQGSLPELGYGNFLYASVEYIHILWNEPSAPDNPNVEFGGQADFVHGPSMPRIAVKFTGGTTEAREKFLAFRLGEIGTIATRLEKSAGLTSVWRAYQVPEGFWTNNQDCWTTNLANLLALPNGLESASLAYTTLPLDWRTYHLGTPFIVTPAAGVTILEAEGPDEFNSYGTRYACLWEIGDIVNLG